MTEQRARITAEVGVGLYGTVREAVAALKWRGYDIECVEGSGWFSRTFYFTGSLQAIDMLQSLLRDWE